MRNQAVARTYHAPKSWGRARVISSNAPTIPSKIMFFSSLSSWFDVKKKITFFQRFSTSR
jgi:hypothetical protein